MSTSASLAIGSSERHTDRLEPLTEFWSQVSARLCQFLEEMPEGYEDVDPEVFKRVPTPI
jgi:hypothetical protein